MFSHNDFSCVHTVCHWDECTAAHESDTMAEQILWGPVIVIHFLFLMYSSLDPKGPTARVLAETATIGSNFYTPMHEVIGRNMDG